MLTSCLYLFFTFFYSSLEFLTLLLALDFLKNCDICKFFFLTPGFIQLLIDYILKQVFMLLNWRNQIFFSQLRYNSFPCLLSFFSSLSFFLSNYFLLKSKVSIYIVFSIIHNFVVNLKQPCYEFLILFGDQVNENSTTLPGVNLCQLTFILDLYTFCYLQILYCMYILVI